MSELTVVFGIAALFVVLAVVGVMIAVWKHMPDRTQL